MRNIAIITGTRAEYGIWKPVLAAIQSSKKLRLQLVVTGMHLQKQFGHTIDTITEPIAAKVPMYFPKDTPADSLARGTAGMAAAFQKLKPDLVMVLGDRLEILAAANAALACQLPLAHLHGGETAPGQWDEQIRHAITKIAHLHFCSTQTAARRIQQMGEDPKTIHLVGAPALDSLIPFIRQRPPRTQYDEPLALLLLHPSSSNDNLESRRTALLFRAFKKLRLPVEVIGPNNDPGHRGILAAYEKLGAHPIMNLPQQSFFHRLATRDLLIGNSSAGILEAASFAIPVINLGDRQKGRERNPNVLDLPWSAGEAGIRKAIRFALTNKPFLKKVAQRKNLYGTGQAAPRILQILESLKFPLSTTKSFHTPKR